MRFDSIGWLAVLAVAVALLAVVVLPLGWLGDDPMVPALVVAASAALVVLVRWRAGPRDSGGSVWDAIPSWQYDGRHVESGGLTRDEQERALEEVEAEARRRQGP